MFAESDQWEVARLCNLEASLVAEDEGFVLQFPDPEDADLRSRSGFTRRPRESVRKPRRKPLPPNVGDLRSSIFFNPDLAGLLQVWQYAGPSCCVKAAGLARGAGPVGTAEEHSVGQVLFSEKGGAASAECSGNNKQTKPGLRFALGAALPWKRWWATVSGPPPPDLMDQIQSGSHERMISLDRVWIALRMRPELVNAVTFQGRVLLAAVRAGRRDIAELLRLSGAELSSRVADELLKEAAMKGDSRCIEVLLYDKHGRRRTRVWANPNQQHKGSGCVSHTPRDLAEARGHHEAAMLLRAVGGRSSVSGASRDDQDVEDDGESDPEPVVVRAETAPPWMMSADLL